jgi:hypothetical protein
MPRYFFNVNDGAEVPDNEGTVLADQEAARSYARNIAAELGRTSHSNGWRIAVTDVKGDVLFEIPVEKLTV